MSETGPSDLVCLLGERLARTAEGVAVVHVVADDETGEVASIEVLARHGAIPDEFEQQIRAV